MNSLVGKFISVCIHPWQTVADLKSEGENASIKSAMMFIIFMGLIAGIFSSVWGFIIPPPQVVSGQAAKWTVLWAIPIVPIILFVFSFISAFGLWTLVHGLLKGTMVQYKGNYRLFALLAAFSPLNSIFTPIPKIGIFIGILINIWGLIIIIRGVIVMEDTPPVRTWAWLGTIFLFLLGMGLIFRNEIERQVQAGGPALTDLGGPAAGDNLGADDTALNKELKDLADQAKSAPTPESPKK